MRTLLGLTVLFCGAIQMHAQIPVTVQIDGASCPTAAFTASSYSIPKGGTISLSKQFDACSPALFEALVAGRHFATLTLTENNGSGQELKIVATDVMIVGFTIAESSSSGAPAETWTFDYAADSWSYQTLSGGGEPITFSLGPVSLHGSVTTVQFFGVDGSSIQASELGCSFDALNWSFGASVNGTNKPYISPVSIMKPVDSCSLALAEAQKSGRLLKGATLTTQLTGSITPLLKITLKDVVVSTNSTSTPKNGPATELITLSHDQIEVQYYQP
jgi:type VI protein secretion system component Hcp